MTTATATSYTHRNGYTYTTDELTAWADGNPPVHRGCGLRHDLGAIDCRDEHLITALGDLAEACVALGLDPEAHAGPAALGLAVARRYAEVAAVLADPIASLLLAAWAEAHASLLHSEAGVLLAADDQEAALANLTEAAALLGA